MFEVVDHFGLTVSRHGTQTEALAVGRSMARLLAAARGLGPIVEEESSCDLLICGTVLDENGTAIDLEPLVWIDPQPLTDGSRQAPGAVAAWPS